MLEDKAMHYDDDEVIRSERGAGQTFGDVVTARLSRRSVLGAAAAGLLLSAVPGIAQTGAKKSPTGLNFEPIPPSTSGEIVLSKGYKHQVLVRWGDPLFADVADGPVEEMTPERQAKSFGYNNDFVGFMPLPFGRERSDHGLLAVNHEYINPELMFDIADPEILSKDQIGICLEAVGFAVVEIKRENSQWRVVKSKKYNKRWTGTSKLKFSGPAAGDVRMRTEDHPEGKTCTGTFHNCAAGKTPWGTVLSGEENFQGFYGFAPEKSDPKEDRSRARYGIEKGKSAYGFERHQDRFHVGKTPNEPNHFGWVVEIDPYDPDWTPVKRTTLGRFRHEAATAHITRDKQVVMYSGDDSRFEYVFKFVCEGRYNPRNRKANRELLDKGTLYVAKFNADGSGEWLPLIHGQGPLTSANGLDNQADVLIDARIAADLLGATKMDRPEDIEVNPVNEKVYIVCTNNTQRGRDGFDGVDAANPRVQNRHGHIIELVEEGGDHTAT